MAATRIEMPGHTSTQMPRITANTPEVGEAHEDMAVNYKGKDMSIAFNPAPISAAGRLRVAAATTVGDKGFARTEGLIAALRLLMLPDEPK